MKTIIAGSRGMGDFKVIKYAVHLSNFKITEVVSGTARGVDILGEEYAKLHDIPVRRFKPQWDALGKRAGFVRNEEMAKYADALIAVWDGESRGTKHMINIAEFNGLKVYIYNYGEGNVRT